MKNQNPKFILKEQKKYFSEITHLPKTKTTMSRTKV